MARKVKEKIWEYQGTITLVINVTGTVEADSEEDAESKADEYLQRAIVKWELVEARGMEAEEDSQEGEVSEVYESDEE
jgi:hypothetical protein